MKLKKSKCAIMQPQIEYFAFIVDHHGIHPSPAKVKAILEVQEPQNKTELQPFLGLVNYYRKFTPNMSTLASPLNKLLAKDTPWCWSQECAKSFQDLKETLTSSRVLAHYNPKLEVQLAFDASPFGLGAVISYITTEGEERPIAYASRSLTPAEKNYSVIEKEALAIIFAIRKFQQFFYGRRFTLLTDHQPLTLLFGPKKGIPPIAASRLQRWAIQLSAYQYDIKYRSSKQNANVDAFSRLQCGTSTDNSPSDKETKEVNRLQVARVPVDARLLREETSRDPILSRAAHFTLNGWPGKEEVPDNLKSYYFKRNELTEEEGCLLRGTRVVIPAKYQESVLAELHLNHPGIVRMKALARLHVWWPTLDTDIEQLVRSCKICQTSHGKALSTTDNPWIWPHRPWQRVHVDYCGPFQGGSFLVIIDAKSKWLEVLCMSSTTAEATINTLRTVFATHGLLEELVTDNGAQFIAQEFKDFVRSNKIKHILSAPYHPASNGEAERTVKTFKQSIKAAKGDPGTQNQKITSFLLSYRTPHTTTGCTRAELLMNRRLRARLDLLRPDLRKKVAKPSSMQPRTPRRQLSVGDPVLIRDYRNSHNPSTKGVVISKLGPVTCGVQVEYFIWKRHIDQLKDLSETKIQPEAGEVTEDLLLQPRQDQPAVEPVLPKDYPYSPPQAKDYPKSPPQAKLDQSQTQELVPEATSAKDFPEAKKPAVKSPVKPPQRYPQRVRKPPKRLSQEA